MGLPDRNVHWPARLHIHARVPKMIDVESSVQFVAAHRASASDLGPFRRAAFLESISPMVRAEGRGVRPAAEDVGHGALDTVAIPRHCVGALRGGFLIYGTGIRN